MKTIYLAGNIAGKTAAEATEWRLYATEQLNNGKFTVLDPIRGKHFGAQEEIIGFQHPEFSPTDILERDLGDVRQSDYVLAVLDKLSFGTIFELGYAYRSSTTQILLVLGEDLAAFATHPFVSGTSKLFVSIDDAIEWLLWQQESLKE